MTDETRIAIREVSLPIYQSKGWFRLLGILSIIYGVVTAITVVGIVVAWLPIWMGVLLLQTASAVERAEVSGDKQILYESLTKLKTYFTIQGVIALLGLLAIGAAISLGMVGVILGLLGRS